MKIKNNINRIIIICLASVLTSNSGCAQTKNEKEQDFQQTIQDVITYYNQKNNEKLNQLINKELGIIFLIRIGSNDWWINQKQICLNKNCSYDDFSLGEPYNQQIFTQKISTHYYPLQYASYPDIDCEQATKTGLYVDISKIDHRFSDLIKTNISIADYIDVSIPVLEKELSEIEKLELISRKVILVSDLKPEKGKIY